MGHLGAPWLERYSRKNEEKPDLAVDLLQLKKDMVVADLGAGTGYFTYRMAQKCSIVYAVDIQQEMLDLNARQMKKKNINNVKTILRINSNKIYKRMTKFQNVNCRSSGLGLSIQR